MKKRPVTKEESMKSWEEKEKIKVMYKYNDDNNIMVSYTRLM